MRKLGEGIRRRVSIYRVGKQAFKEAMMIAGYM